MKKLFSELKKGDTFRLVDDGILYVKLNGQTIQSKSHTFVFKLEPETSNFEVCVDEKES